MGNSYNISINKQEAQRILGYQGLNVPLADEIKDYSAYGTPVFMPIFLGDETTGEISYTKGGVTYVIPAMKLLCATVSISQSRNIVKTTIQGGDGDVKEFINNGDWVVNIKAILGADVYAPQGTAPTKSNNRYPIEAVKNIATIAQAPVAIPVSHKLMYELGIYDLVIEDINFVSNPGRESIQVVELACVSDKTFILKEKQSENAILNV